MNNSNPSKPAIKSSGIPRGATLSSALTLSLRLEISASESLTTSTFARASSILAPIDSTSFFTSATDLGPSALIAEISDCKALALVSNWLVFADSSESIDFPTPIPSSKLPYSSM